MKYKMMLAFILCASLAAGCGSTGTTAESADTETETVEETETTTELKPLNAAVDLSDLTDCTVPVSFDADSFNWMGGNLTMSVYDVLCYDTVDVHNLAVGSTVDVGDEVITVDSIDEDSSTGIIINSGEETEFCLQPQDGGIYQIVGENDVRRMVCLGETEAVLSEDVTLQDCTDQPGETVDVSSDEIKSYMENLTDGRESFYESNTTVTIENGEITQIVREWTP